VDVVLFDSVDVEDIRALECLKTFVLFPILFPVHHDTRSDVMAVRDQF